MIYTEAPNRKDCGNSWNFNRNIFLAGSISGAHDWQKTAAEKLLPYFNVFNPRRTNYSTFDPNEEYRQIAWEHEYLGLCETILFFFSFETLAPITLLEFGALLESSKREECEKTLYIAIHPEYKRKNDVLIQTELRNPRWLKNITFSLNETIEQIIKEN